MEKLRAEVTEVTDWRKQVRKHRKNLLIGAAVAGFVIGGGIGAVVGLFTSSDRLAGESGAGRLAGGRRAAPAPTRSRAGCGAGCTR